LHESYLFKGNRTNSGYDKEITNHNKVQNKQWRNEPKYRLFAQSLNIFKSFKRWFMPATNNFDDSL